MANRDRETMETVKDFIFKKKKKDFIFLGPKSMWDGDCSQVFAPWKKSHDKPRECIKKQRHYFVDKGPTSQSYGFSSNHIWMWELNHKEGSAQNWCFRTVVLKKTLESPVNCKIKSVNPKGNQPWIFTGRTDAESWSSNTLAIWCTEPIYWKRPWCWERQKAGEGGDKGWDGWMTVLTQCTSLSKFQEMVKDRSMGLQSVRHD